MNLNTGESERMSGRCSVLWKGVFTAMISVSLFANGMPSGEESVADEVSATEAILTSQEGVSSPENAAERSGEKGIAELEGGVSLSPHREAEAVGEENRWVHRSGFSERMRYLQKYARQAASVNDHGGAEKFYLQLLQMDLSDVDRHNTILEMADMYHRAGISTKTAAVYEKFLELFPQDPDIPGICLRLGLVYRDIGAFRMAITKFYSVLNRSLIVPKERMDSYKRLSIKAQLEIAETYFQMGDYQAASTYFDRLSVVSLNLKDRASVHFKSAYVDYLLEEYSTMISKLQDFIKHYPESRLIPESHFLLVSSYKKLNRPREAMEETLKLLQKNQRQQSLGNENKDLWFYWKRRTGNQVANEFYEQRDFLSALKIYQTMAKLNDNPEWQWPIVYQIGLCFERLRMLPKARQAYELIVSGSEWEGREYTVTANLESIREMAAWRLNHLGWATESEARIVNLFEPKTS